MSVNPHFQEGVFVFPAENHRPAEFNGYTTVRLDIAHEGDIYELK
jgi:hypothetical protein